MSQDTKTKITEVALNLFSQYGYAGTSMSDIAAQLGITKPALYKHYASKQEILNSIVKRMRDTDDERARRYRMPDANFDDFANAYIQTPSEKIRAYSIAQFRHWTEDPFCAQFRKMIATEQYRNDEIGQLYQNYLVTGPLEYMAAIFRKATDSDCEAMQMALDFYGPMYLLYGVYDGAKDQKVVFDLLGNHVDGFIAKTESLKVAK